MDSRNGSISDSISLKKWIHFGIHFFEEMDPFQNPFLKRNGSISKSISLKKWIRKWKFPFQWKYPFQLHWANPWKWKSSDFIDNGAAKQYEPNTPETQTRFSKGVDLLPPSKCGEKQDKENDMRRENRLAGRRTQSAGQGRYEPVIQRVLSLHIQ